jgi:FemAB family
MVTWNIFEGTASDWDQYLLDLQGTFYQTFNWGEVKKVSGWEPLRLIAISKGGAVSAVSILVKRRACFVICWIPDGSASLIKLLDNKFCKTLSSIFRSNFIYCRVSFLSHDIDDKTLSLLRNGWKRPKQLMSSGLTMLYDLYGEQDQRIQKVSGNWRHNLKRSDRYNLQIDHWKEPNANLIAALYREMELLKGLPVQHSLAELEAIIGCLRGSLVIFRCLSAEGDLLALRAAGIFGERALDLLAVSGAAARKLYATHATLWALLNWCQENGCKYYDLSGVDPIGNKGVYDFKHGTGASLVECLGEWEWASIPGIRLLVNWLISRKK